jgi:hypothetical protein
MVPAFVSEPATPNEAHTLEEVLMIAGRNGTEPFCSSFGPIGPKYLFAALVTAYNASGSLDAAWMSEPMFGTSQAAQDYADDVIGPDIYAIINIYDASWNIS